MAGITPSSTVGPFFLFGLVPSTIGGTDVVSNDLVTPDASGTRIRIEGSVFDGDGATVPDALIELWQADAAGRYAHAGREGARRNTAFRGFGRAATDESGRYRFDTIKPGPVPGPNGAMQAPHIIVNVFARGVLKQMVTRIYFSDEEANASDPVLALVPEDRRSTLIATQGDGVGRAYAFDIHLQGERETVFFEA
ncbi:MAG TPA: protocatechuate 3,4-dioxygenase subunit alpha [Xanthobacteraceae bacterium]|nr:protocatechuate 3,4-dioxygenase subunit alpha [Xanthobacteraceae bacterium]